MNKVSHKSSKIEQGILTIHDMIQIAKYFHSNNDYVNVMKVNKKFSEMIEMHYSQQLYDCSLFTDLETFYISIKNEKTIEGYIEN